MTDFPLKTPGQLYASNPVTPALSDILLAWQQGALGGVTAEDLLGLVTKAMIGLGEVDNTADTNKPVSTAQAQAVAEKLAIAENLNDLADKVAARGNLGANDAGNLTTGTLSDARVSATLTPDQAFRRGNVVGTVSQSGGVPTGAIVERGSNASGDYVRFSDGSQITTRTNASVSDAGITITHSAAFAAAPAVVASPRNPLSGATGGSYVVEMGSITTTSVSVKALAHTPTTVDGTTVTCSVVAIGRWF